MNQIQLYKCAASNLILLYCISVISPLLHLTLEDRRAGKDGMREDGRPWAGWGGAAEPGSAWRMLEEPKVKWSWLEFLTCFSVSLCLSLLWSLLLYSHHMPSQNKIRLRCYGCMLKILRPACLAKQLSNAPYAQCIFWQVYHSDELKTLKAAEWV